MRDPSKKNKTSVRTKKDQVLIECALLGDQSAYKALMAQYYHPIFYMILRIIQNKDDASDLTMEVFAKAFCNLEKYETKFAFSTWLFRIATNHSIDFIKKKRLATISIYSQNSDATEEDILEIEDVNDLTPEHKCLRKEKKELVHSIIDKLPESYQVLVKLRYIREFSYLEIAKELNLPLGTVKAKLMRSKKLLLTIFIRSGQSF